MKILITTDLFTTATNGVVTSVRNLWNELKCKGHDVRILTLSDNMKSHKDGDVYYIRSLPLGVYPDVRMPASYRHRFIQELIDWKPDVIHSQCEMFSMQFAQRISEMTDAPIVHTYHTMYEQYIGYVVPGEKFGKWVVRYLTNKRLESVKLVIVPTDKMKKILDDYSVNKQICVVPSGISLEQHQKRMSPEQRKEKRNALGIEDDQPVLINLGRLGNEKNLEELLNYFAAALIKDKNIMLLIVGDGPAREKLQKQAMELEISEHVIFTGMVEPSKVQDYYQLGDIFVSASTSETQGLTYIEAAANGLPLLCRQDPCLENVIEKGENGYEYTCEKEFIEAIHTVIRNPDWRKSAGKRSEEIAAAFDKKAFGTVIESIYESVKMNELEV